MSSASIDTRIGYVFDSLMEAHRGGMGHPERPSRIRSIHQRLGERGLLERVKIVAGRPATDEELFLVHPQVHVDRVMQFGEEGASKSAFDRAEDSEGPYNPSTEDEGEENYVVTARPEKTHIFPFGADTYVCKESPMAAKISAGCVLSLIEEIMDEDSLVDRGFACVRPPGHHATTSEAMGFCLFNNVAIAAQALRQRYGLQRVAVVDWDVHHGNGTCEIFAEDPTVLVISIHRFDGGLYYPGTGNWTEMGSGDAVGYNLNVPIDGTYGDEELQFAFDKFVLPALSSFRPEFILVSCGFDACVNDPLEESTATSSDADPEDPPLEDHKALPATSSILGGVLCMIGVFFFSLTQLCAYLASDEFSGSEITVVRSLVQTVGATLFALLVGVNPIGPPGLRVMCFIRGFVGALANLLLLYAVAHMPMADANAIFFTNPIFTAVYAALVLKQRVSIVEVVALFLGLTGSFLVVRPSFIFGSQIAADEHRTDLTAYVVNIIGAATAGAVPIIVCFIGSSVHYVCLVFAFGACGLVESASSLAIGLDTMTTPSVATAGDSYLFMLGTGIFGTLSQFFYNRSLQLEKPQTCAIIFQANVAFTFLWQAWAKPTEISWLSVLGALMIVCSSSAILGAKVVMSRAAEATTRQPGQVKSMKVSVGVDKPKE
ncbi:hypothetical protein FOZ61_002423 [Perkinsus olseni]|uniref:histone deacetylase n=1 Tax=Perkinsus olseni TaxID=32597 RepID=A0A7J6LT36_PEROL|nr:hypothetical protein FOZ61_002423 [Perkinsus olseni]